MFLAPGMPLITLRITSWKISEAEDIPKSRRLYRNKPACVLKVKMYLDERSTDNILTLNQVLNIQLSHLSHVLVHLLLVINAFHE